MQPKENIYQEVTDRIIAGLEKGRIPWKSPIRSEYSMFPRNFKTKKFYRGINFLLLQLSDHESRYYGTFRQITESGGKLNKGAKSIPIVFWDLSITHKQSNQKITWDEYSKFSLDQKRDYRVTSFGRFYRVFNLEETSDIDYPRSLPDKPLNERIEACQSIVDGYKNGPKIEHRSCIPCYIPSRDLVQIPDINEFANSESYYHVLLHELSHSSGSKNRLCREGITGKIQFNSFKYSFEELVVEIASNFLATYAGISNPPLEENSQAYINGWLDKIRGDKFLIFRAAGKAQAAYNYILGNQVAN